MIINVASKFIDPRIVIHVSSKQHDIALILLILATFFTSGITVESALLTAINAVIVALAAMGAYEVVFRKFDEKKKVSGESPEEQKEE